jgi:hypothetical protein
VVIARIKRELAFIEKLLGLLGYRSVSLAISAFIFWISGEWFGCSHEFVSVMLGQEEVVEKVVHAEQAVAGEDDGGILNVEEALAPDLG